MRSLLILLAVVGVAVGKPAWLGLGVGARGLYHAPAAYPHVVSPVAISSQYHSQDEIGQYSYGYAGGPSAKSEVKTWDGVTRGGYSYVDAEGKLQNVNYVADPVHGFRVAATNLPVAPEAAPAEPLEAPVPVEDTPEVAAAKEEHFALYAEAKAAADAAPDDPEPAEAPEPIADAPAPVADAPAPIAVAPLPADTFPVHAAPVVAQPAYHTNILPYSYPIAAAPASRFAYSYAAPAYYPAPTNYYAYGALAAPAAPAPIAYAAAPAYVAPAPVAPVPAPIAYAAPSVVTSQYHTQDEIGQYSYGYAGGPSTKTEVKSWDGVTRGGYSYVDAEGKVQSVNYVSDPIHGFRVAATNLPVAPQSPVLETVPDTAEVAAAKSAHLAAWEEAKISLEEQQNSVKSD
ncbi:atherin-like [Ischnura elegans]|uniref:atherin-like n=1 Tax=Ischnura elegans TaxID=197161 RepID=UPI001ED868D8|nr:atherin-like [Ischnura elegans]